MTQVLLKLKMKTYKSKASHFLKNLHVYRRVLLLITLHIKIMWYGYISICISNKSIFLKMLCYNNNYFSIFMIFLKINSFTFWYIIFKIILICFSEINFSKLFFSLDWSFNRISLLPLIYYDSSVSGYKKITISNQHDTKTEQSILSIWHFYNKLLVFNCIVRWRELLILTDFIFSLVRTWRCWRSQG